MSIRSIWDTELEHGSDKWEPYFDVYERYLNKFIGKSPVVVEIGVQSGGSIEMWKKYFGEGSIIVGIDIDPRVLENKSDGVEIVIGDQGTPEFWDEFLKSYPEIDILIDDGGHHCFQQILTFEKVFPHLNGGGVFICEDTHTSYQPFTGGSVYGTNTFIEYSKRLVEYLHKDFIGIAEDEILRGLSCVNFYNSQIILEKNEAPFNRVFSGKEKIETFLGIKL